MDINDCLFTFFLFGVINVVDYFLCLYNFLRNLVAWLSPKSERWWYFAFWIFTACQIEGVLSSWILLALDAAYRHVSWLYLQQVGNVLKFVGMDKGLGELWNTWMICVFVIFMRLDYGRIIYMSLPGSRPGACGLQALSKTYRNLPFLSVVSWNPGKKTNVISPAPMQLINWNVNAARYRNDVLRNFGVPSMCRHLLRHLPVGHYSMAMHTPIQFVWLNIPASKL